MNASKFLVSTAAAIAVIGAAGFAYAQTTSPATGAPADPQAQNAAPVTDGAMPADPNTPNQDRTNANGGMKNGNMKNGMNNGMNNGTSGTMHRDANGRMNRGSMNNANGMNNNDASGTAGTAPSDNSNSTTERPARAARN